MSIKARIITFDDLDTEYREPTESTIEGTNDQVHFRLVSCSGKNDKRSYWAARGLSPVVHGSGLVKNEHLYSVSADGVLRVGEQEIWVEHIQHYHGRGAALAQKAKEQYELTEALARLKSAGKESGTPFSGVKGRPAIETEEMTVKVTRRGRPPKEVTQADFSQQPEPDETPDRDLLGLAGG